MTQIVPRLSRLLDGGFQAFVPLPLHDQKLVFLPEPCVAVQADSHQQEDRIEAKQQHQQRDTEHDVDLKDTPGLERCLIAGGHNDIEQDKYEGQQPEHVPRLREMFVLHHRAYSVGGWVVRRRREQPAGHVVKDARAQAEPRLQPWGPRVDQERRADGAGDAVDTGEHCAYAQRDGSGFPAGNTQRFHIDQRCRQCEDRLRRLRGALKTEAEQSASDTRPHHQGQQPRGKPPR